MGNAFCLEDGPFLASISIPRHILLPLKQGTAQLIVGLLLYHNSNMKNNIQALVDYPPSFPSSMCYLKYVVYLVVNEQLVDECIIDDHCSP